MPKDLFSELDTVKRTKIINVAISEFALHGYMNSSTNRIVKSSNISKGSLFKYFHNKEDLYFYILDTISNELISSLGEKTDKLSKDLFKRVIEYSELEFAWYIENPEKYKIIAAAFTKNDTEIYQKTAARYNLIGQNIYYNVLEGIETIQFRWDRKKTVDILKWFLAGFNQDFMNRTDVQKNSDVDRIRSEYVDSLTEYIEILKVGLLR